MREFESQPDQPEPYRLPFPRIHQHRQVEDEETGNNMLAIPTVLGDLTMIARYEKEKGVPQTHMFDDLDRDTIMAVPMDAEWRMMVRAGAMKEKQRLEKKGVIFPR